MAEKDIQNAENMANQRRSYIDINFPELKRDDYASDDAFAEALREQYRQLRTREYEWEVNRQSLEMYTASVGVPKINRDIWIKPLGRSEQPDSCAVTAYERQPVMNPNARAPWVKNGGIACCAKTAVSVVGQVSDNLGYTGTDNFTTQTDKRCSLASAAGVHDAIGNKEYKKEGKLCDLIKSGEIGPGAIVSVPSPNNGGSGYHAMVLADVRYDKDGNIQGYYLQGNNRTSYSYCGINETKGNNTKKVICTATNEWMGDRIADELSGKTPEELQAMIDATRDRLVSEGGSIDKLKNAEAGMMNLFTQRVRVSNPMQITNFIKNYEEDLGILTHQNANNYAKLNFVESPEVIVVPEIPKVVPKIENVSEPQSTTKSAASATEAVSEETSAVVENTAERPSANLYAAAGNQSVRDMFATMDSDTWASLVSAYMVSYDQSENVGDSLRSDAAIARGVQGPLIDNLCMQGGNEELPDLLEGYSAYNGLALSDDKAVSDAMFEPFLAALTAKDDKGLDASMKQALGLLTEFLGGVEKDPDNGVPSLSDFMTFLADNRDNASENEQGRQTLQTAEMSPFMLNMLNQSGRA